MDCVPRTTRKSSSSRPPEKEKPPTFVEGFSFSTEALGSLHREVHVGGAAALVTLDRHRDLVQVAEVHAELCPFVEMIGDGDGAASALLLTHAPILVERRVALDRRLVHALRLVDVVAAAVAIDGADG